MGRQITKLGLLLYSEFYFRRSAGSFAAHPGPHGYENSPGHVDYSSKFLKVVRDRTVPSSKLGIPTNCKQDSLDRGSLACIN